MYLLFIGAVISIIRSYSLQVENIELNFPHWPQELDGLKIALLSDLHLPLNMLKIEQLLPKLSEQKPDLIMLVGDIVHKKMAADKTELADLLKQLRVLAPVYMVPGNHEQNNPHWEQQTKIYQEQQVPVLNNDLIRLQIKNSSLSIWGLNLSPNAPTPNLDTLFPDKEADLAQILLSHQPERWPACCQTQSRLNPALTLSGHAHGGQFRLPKAIYAPQQGLFPQFTSGLYQQKSGASLVVSRGLGYSSFPFRINNRIHLPIITIHT
ncbi:MAG: metallophosphoesterase [Clostridia bacterium]|nr:metallophosphoesterase [Clostridia bacterium]